MTQALAAVIPDNLAAHFRVANMRQGVIVLQAGSSAVAAKLRMLVPTMKSCLEPTFGALADIRIQVSADLARRDAPAARPRLPPRAAEAALQELARGLDDCRLRTAVLRLARKARSGRG